MDVNKVTCHSIRPDCRIQYVGQTENNLFHVSKSISCGHNKRTFAQHLIYIGKAMHTADRVTAVIYTAL